MNRNSFRSDLGEVKIVRFNLDSDSCRVDIPVGIFLNSKNFFSELFTFLELDFDVEYIIGLSFVGDDGSINFVEEYMLFNSSYLLTPEFDVFYTEFYKFVNDCRGKIVSKTGLDSSVVDVVIYNS